MASRYYRVFKLIDHNPLWKRYLISSYRKGVAELAELAVVPDFDRKGFTSLLCGTAGAATSRAFVRYVLSRNRAAPIVVLDRSEIPLEESKRVLDKEFPEAAIAYLRCDARKMPLKRGSVDYVETDAFLEYFPPQELDLLLAEWSRVLRKDGFITTRAFASDSFFGTIVDNVRLLIAKHVFGVQVYRHTKEVLGTALRRAGFRFVIGGNTFLPTFKRFSIVKQSR